MNNNTPLLFSGSSVTDLAKEICAESRIILGKVALGQFPDKEISVEILDDVRGREVFVLQSIAVDPNRYLVELLLMIDALKRGFAGNIVAVVPYLGYCRQDRKNKLGVPISAKLIAKLLSLSGIARLITCDLHAGQMEGFFDIPVEHLHCQSLLARTTEQFIDENWIVVSPDTGGIQIAETMADLLCCKLAVIKKQRLSPFDVKVTLIGEVAGKNVLIVDDLCSTGGTLMAALKVCKDHGAKKIGAAVTHGGFVAEAVKKIDASSLEFFLMTNTISLFESSKKIRQVSVAPLLAQAIDLFRN